MIKLRGFHLGVNRGSVVQRTASSDRKATYIEFLNSSVLAGLVGIVRIGLYSIVLVAVLTKTLGAEQYGLWVQALALVALMLPLLDLGLIYSMTRFVAGHKEPTRKSEEFYSVAWYVLVVGIGAGLALPLIAHWFLPGASDSRFLGITGLLLTTTVWQTLYIGFLRANLSIRVYVTDMLIYMFCEVLAVSLLAIYNHTIYDILAAATIIRGINGLLLAIYVTRSIPFVWPNVSLFVDRIKFSVPLALSELFNVITIYADRFVLTYFMNSWWVGAYSAAYTLGNLPTVFIGLFGLTWPAFMSKQYDSERREVVLELTRRLLKYFRLVAVPSIFLLLALGKIALEWIATSSIASAGYHITPLIAVSGLFLGEYSIVSHIIFLGKRTSWLSFVWFVVAILNLSLNLVLVPLWGLYGAAVSTVAAYLFLDFATAYLARRILDFSYDWHGLLKICGASVLLYSGVRGAFEVF
ncbi:MAG: hypothetical protein C4293_04950, partial [Nitrospiraceae bacterium]